jgi:Fe2+ or Zn2+ uptake regulation protein
LLSFFALPPNNDKLHNNRVQHFYDSPDYTKAHVTAYRSITSLVKKGLVHVFQFGGDSMMINLTDEGMKKAAELLGISEYLSPFKP